MICPLCGKGIITERNCPVCGYEYGSDPEIDNDPVPVGGLPDEILVQQRTERKRQVWSVMPGFGLIALVIGIIIQVNGGPVWVTAVGIAILLCTLIALIWNVCGMSSKAWYNRTRWWAYGKEPTWMKKGR